MPPYGKASYLITYVIDHDKFNKFIDKFISGALWDGSLAKRYEYIYLSKIYLLSEIFRNKDPYSILERTKYEVKLKVLNSLSDALKATLMFRKDLEQEMYIVLNILPRHFPQDALFIAHRLMERTYFTMEEFKHFIDNIQSIIDYPPLIFREFRKMLEMLVLILFEATMFQRDIQNFYEIIEFIDEEQKKHLKHIINYLYDQVALDVMLSWDTKEYFDKIGQEAYIKSLSKIVDKEVIIELREALNLSINKLRKLLEKNISWILLFTLSSLHSKKSGITAIEVDERLLDIMTHLQSLFLAKSLTNDKRLIDEYADKIYYTIRRLQKTYSIIYPVPSISFLIQYAEKHIKGSKLNKLYSDYCFFVHTYPSSLQLYPYMSILEYRMLPNELGRFYTVASKIIDSIIDALYASSQYLRKLYSVS